MTHVCERRPPLPRNKLASERYRSASFPRGGDPGLVTFSATASFSRVSYLRDLDYSVVQQCMHCGMCLPTCPTYMETKLERNSPRGRISLMRAIADGRLTAKKQFADEMYFWLG